MQAYEIIVANNVEQKVRSNPVVIFKANNKRHYRGKPMQIVKLLMSTIIGASF